MAEERDKAAPQGRSVREATIAATPSPGDGTIPRALVQGRHGRFLVLARDLFVGRSLALYGEYSEGEVALLSRLVPQNGLVVEAGANIGAHTVPLARMVGPKGAVVAFEPQRIVHQTLCANVALNGLGNVWTYPMACGRHGGRARMPAPDYARAANFGGISLGSGQGEMVNVQSVDSLGLPALDLLKADVEGMEAHVVEGARKTIDAHRPVIYLENDRRENSAGLISLLKGMDYRLWWHLPPLFNPDNHRRNPQNAFPSIVSVNLLCLPRESSRRVEGLREVQGPADWWR